MSKIRTLHALLLALIVAGPATAAGPQISQVPALPPTPPPAPVSTATEGMVVPAEGEKEERKPRSLFDDAMPLDAGMVAIRMAMPPNSRAVDTIALYPYPVKPPVVTGPPSRLPTTPKDLKYLLLATGYTGRPSPDKSYQAGGWRWQYALAEAERRSGLKNPYTIMGAYQWIDDITPFVLAETKKWNDFEKARFARYQKCVEEFEKTHADLENEASQQGLTPMNIREHKSGTTKVRVPAGNWWVTCTRKAPALTWYWQVPFTVGPGENTTVSLDWKNALIVKGGW
jgi:hypothetical protein